MSVRRSITPKVNPIATIPKPEPVIRNVARVIKVVDGYTLKVRGAGIGTRTVRLLGIDTPEKHGRREAGRFSPPTAWTSSRPSARPWSS